MADRSAFCVFQTFGAEADRSFRFDRHYLLYAAKGSMRLEAGGRAWSLPPSRAALIRAQEEIRVTIPHEIQGCSVLFDPQSFQAPEAALSVFEISALARALILECRRFGPNHPEPDREAELFFQTLALIAHRLAETPSPAWITAPRSPEIRRALAATDATLDDESADFDGIAKAAQAAPRTLARRFQDELGMPWQLVRRRLRMIRASELLAEDVISITEIAHQVGYSSASAFNTAFRDFAGTTPRLFRASARGAL